MYGIKYPILFLMFLVSVGTFAMFGQAAFGPRMFQLVINL